MDRFVAINVSSRLIGKGSEEVFYPISRILKIQHGTHGGSQLTLTALPGKDSAEEVGSTDTPELILTKIRQLSE